MADIPAGFTLFTRSSPYLDLVGPLYMKHEAGTLVLGVRIEERHCNRRGVAHGGLLVTLADLVLGYSSGQSEDPPKPLATINLSADFAGSARVGDWVEARADVQKVGRSVAFASCYINVGRERIVRASAVFKVASMKP